MALKKRLYAASFSHFPSSAPTGLWRCSKLISGWICKGKKYPKPPPNHPPPTSVTTLRLAAAAVWPLLLSSKRRRGSLSTASKQKRSWDLFPLASVKTILRTVLFYNGYAPRIKWHKWGKDCNTSVKLGLICHCNNNQSSLHQINLFFCK